MSWPLSVYKIAFPRRKRIWVQVRILHETKKAILVYTVRKIWVPKSRISGIRLKKGIFEIYVKEGVAE